MRTCVASVGCMVYGQWNCVVVDDLLFLCIFARADLIEVMMLQNVQMQQLVMQQMMLQAATKPADGDVANSNRRTIDISQLPSVR